MIPGIRVGVVVVGTGADDKEDIVIISSKRDLERGALMIMIWLVLVVHTVELRVYLYGNGVPIFR